MRIKLRRKAGAGGAGLAILALVTKAIAGAGLAILVLVTVTVLMVGLFTLAARAKRLKPRTLPAEDTNSFYHYFRPELEFASPPQQADPNPPSLAEVKGVAATGPAYVSHTNSVTFDWTESVSNGWVLILRSEDFVNWTVLQWVLFEEPTFTNSTAHVQFVDPYAPPAGAFYRGLILTNAP